MHRELRFARDEIGPVHYRFGFEIENEVDVSLSKILYDHLKKIVSRLASHVHVEGTSLTFVILSLTSLAIIRYTSNNKSHRLQFVKRIARVASL